MADNKSNTLLAVVTTAALIVIVYLIYRKLDKEQVFSLPPEPAPGPTPSTITLASSQPSTVQVQLPSIALDYALINFNTSGVHTIVTGIAGQKTRVYELFLWNVSQQNLELLNGSDTLTGPINSFPAASGIYWPYTGSYHLECDDGRDLNLNMSASTQVSGFILYTRSRSV